MNADDRAIITARFKELDAQNKTIILLLADLRRHFDDEISAVRRQIQNTANAARRVADSVTAKETLKVIPSEVHHAYKK